jgi:hypothetical protein
MPNHPTLAEVKRVGDQVLAETQAAIDTARLVIINSRKLNAEVRRAMADFKTRRECSLEVLPYREWKSAI